MLQLIDKKYQCVSEKLDLTGVKKSRHDEYEIFSVYMNSSSRTTKVRDLFSPD